LYVHGSYASWIYDILFDICDRRLTKDIEATIDHDFPVAVLEVSQNRLAALSYHIPIGYEEYMSLELTTDPVLTSETMDTYFEGTFGLSSDPSWHYPLTITPHTLEDGDFTPMKLVTTADVPNSLLASLVDRGVLDYNITSADVPDAYKTWFPMDIHSLALSMPGLRDIFPDQTLGFELLLSPSVYPTVSFSASEGMGLVADATVSAVALDPYRTVIFDLDLHLSLDIDPVLYSNSTDVYISATLGYESVSLQPVYTLTDSLDLDNLNTLMAIVLDDVMVPLWNDAFEVLGGIPLPVVPGVTFVNPSMLYGEGLFQIGTDFTFSL
ncbi:hypothetical protein KIPB_010399, partial [Kipferlia bialata]